LEFWRYYRIIRRRRWLILLGMAICVGMVAYSNMNSVQSYMGHTTLMEPKGMAQEGIPLYPEQYTQLDVQLRLSNLSAIASSAKVRQRAADALHDFDSTLTPEEIANTLQQLDVHAEKDTNILALEITLPSIPRGSESREAAEARTREYVTVATEVVAAEFKKYYSELNNSAVTQSREFIQAQLESTHKAMVDAQNKVRKFMEENGVVRLDQQGVSLVQRLEQTKTGLSEAQGAYEAAVARTKSQSTELKSLPEWEKISESTALNPIWQQLSEQLTQAESEKAAMMADPATGKSGRLANHPDVIAIQRKIDDIKGQLRTGIKDQFAAAGQPQYILAQKNEQKSMAYQNAFDRWLQSKVEEAGAAAQVQAMNDEIARIHGEMSAMPARDAKYAELQADVQSATTTYGLMRQKLDEARLREQQTQSEVSLKTIDPAYSIAVGNKQVLKLILALVLSPILGIGVAFLLYYTDNTVKTASEAEKLLGLPVLCAVPESRAHAFSRQRCPEIVDVAYQMLTSNIWIASQNGALNGLVVVSAEPNVGRSVTASNLAISLAREGARVVLVDADLRQPSQHLMFGVENKVGLTNVIAGAATLEDVLVPTKIQGLLLVPTGPVPDNPVKLLRSEEFKSIDEQIKDVADFVIYDTPAGVTFPDPVLVAAHVGAAVVVHSAGRVPRGSEADLNARLESIGVKLFGVILNKVKREDSSSYFHYRRSYQGIATAQLPGGKKVGVG